MRKTATKPRDTHTKNISPETMNLIDAFKKATREIISSNDSRAFLVRTGIYTKNGRLSKAYR